MQDTFARATHSAYASGRPSAARDDRVSCIQTYFLCTWYTILNRRARTWPSDSSARASKDVLHTNILCMHGKIPYRRARLTSFVRPLGRMRARAKVSCIQFMTRQGNFRSARKEAVLILERYCCVNIYL